MVLFDFVCVCRKVAFPEYGVPQDGATMLEWFGLGLVFAEPFHAVCNYRNRKVVLTRTYGRRHRTKSVSFFVITETRTKHYYEIYKVFIDLAADCSASVRCYQCE